MPSFQNPGSGLGSNGASAGQAPAQAQKPKKLILCFDGTGNTFSGSNADTNVVKILSQLDRNDPDQYHYYQTGIGTYDINEQSVNKTWIGGIRSSISQNLDQGFGTTFDAHVMAGYRFLMRYYDSGDKIYMFGFSRGAFTARFLARMIHTVGLLCKGNEEMVHFAYRLYQRYLAGEITDTMSAHPEHDHNTAPNAGTGKNEAAPQLNGESEHHDHDACRDEITAFSSTFCRKEQRGNRKEDNIKVYFLGIWDCVNSVAVLERTSPKPVTVRGTAQYVRHAVAVDERRVKFKAALFAQDVPDKNNEVEDVKEVWFPGCHGDVGGGWPAVADNPLDSHKDMTTWERLKNFLTTRKPKEPSRNVKSDPFQMSDIPLAWMIQEVKLVGKNDPSAAVKWHGNYDSFKERFRMRKLEALGGFMHDPLRFGFGTAFFKVLLWKFLEWFPLTTRWELTQDKWVSTRFPLNRGATRDIPRHAVLHESLLWRLWNDKRYQPQNNHGDKELPCLISENLVDGDGHKYDGKSDPEHQTYMFKYAPKAV